MIRCQKRCCIPGTVNVQTVHLLPSCGVGGPVPTLSRVPSNRGKRHESLPPLEHRQRRTESKARPLTSVATHGAIQPTTLADNRPLRG